MGNVFMVNLKVSIIIPIYNVADHLERCLDSCINQTLQDIEIICINDCSPDNSLSILKTYAEKDERIKIINFEINQGVSIARNTGIKIAKGEYIGFIDPDDYVDLNFYEKLYLKAKETDAEIVHGNLKLKRICDSKEYIICSYKKIERSAEKIYSLFHHTLAIYKSVFLQTHSLEYPSGIRRSQDLVFVTKALYFANKIEFVNDTFYHYIKREGSVSQKRKGGELQFFNEQDYNSYGIPLVFDFINETITDKEEYNHYFGFFINHLLAVATLVAPELLHDFTRKITEIWKNKKYPVNLKSDHRFIDIESLEDAEILYKQIVNYDSSYPKIELKNLENRKLYIWGAGSNGIDALSQCDNNGWQVEAFLDSNKELKEFNGYPVKLPQQVLDSSKNDFFIIISSRNFAEEIAKTCEKAGFKEGLDFWRAR